MQDPQIKKLITGFLILATLASSSALALSRFLTSRADDSAKKATSASLNNAFSNNSTVNLGYSTSSDPSNVTNGLAASLAQEILKQNPNGPLTSSTTTSITLPSNLDSVVGNYISNLKIDDSIFAIDESRIKTKKSASKEDVQNYLQSIASILQESFDNQDFKNLKNKTQNSSDPTLLGAINLLYVQAEDKIYDVQVPDVALNFHRDLLLTINATAQITDQNIFNNDPIKDFALFQRAQTLTSQYATENLKEFYILKLEYKNLSSVKNPWGINRAYAQFAVIDIINYVENFLTDIATTASYYLEYGSFLQKLMIMQIRDRLIKQIVDAIINWANGIGGKSAYVGNWGSFLAKAYYQAAGQILAADAKNYCAPYRDQLIRDLQGLNGIQNNLNLGSGGPGCSLDSTVSNLDAFYSDFSVGGWDGFTALAQNNYYSTLYFENIKISQGAQAQQNAAQSQAVAGNGYTGTESCADGSTPGEQKTYDQDGYLVGYSPSVCADGSEPQVTTPGKNISDLVSKGLGTPIDRILTADPNDWEQLALVLANSAINKLIASGNKGLRNGSVTGSANGDPYAVCSGYKIGTNEYLSCIQNVNDSKNPTGSQSINSKQSLLSQAKQARDQASSTLGYILLTEDAASSSINILNSIVAQNTFCPTQASQANSELISLNQEYSDLLTKADTVTSQISDLDTLISDVTNHDNTDTQYFSDKLIEFQTTFSIVTMGKDNADAKTEAQRMQGKLQDSLALLTSCVKP